MIPAKLPEQLHVLLSGTGTPEPGTDSVPQPCTGSRCAETPFTYSVLCGHGSIVLHGKESEKA